MEPLFRANRAILAQMMLTVRFCQFDVVYWLSVLLLFVICVFVLVFVFVYLYLCICICVFSAERDDPAPPTDGIAPYPGHLPQVRHKSWRGDKSGGNKAVLGLPGLQ